MVARPGKTRMMQHMETASRKSAAPASTTSSVVVLGIDPGLQRTGYAILTSPPGRETCRVVEAGVIRLNPRQPLESRLVELESSLAELISTYQPAVLACEQLYAHYRHPRTAIIMAHARGVILALAARRGLEIVHVAATHVKKYLTGSGRAGKAQVQRAVAATLSLPTIPEPDDVADALAVAFCGLRLRDADRSVRRPRRTAGQDVTKGGRGSCRAAAGTGGSS
jgi:crossover junction endodeoxyribonuclease RuvC